MVGVLVGNQILQVVAEVVVVDLMPVNLVNQVVLVQLVVVQTKKTLDQLEHQLQLHILIGM